MYLIDVIAISPQLTYTDEFVTGDFRIHAEGKMLAIEPSYTDIIPASLLRRMGKAVRMGIGAGLPLIKKYPTIDGVIIGTANGGLEDCIKFLNQIVEYEEGVLTPTNFVSSTPNAVAGQLAMMGQKTGYNSTHTNGSLSFDNVLLDASLYLNEQQQDATLLIGALEEISAYNYNIDQINELYKDELVSNDELLNTKTKGSICGEGATMFVVSNNPNGAKVRYIDQFQITYPSKTNFSQLVEEFLKVNNLHPSEIDLLLFGNSGDVRHDHWYEDLHQDLFADKPVYTYKQFCGDYRTSNGFACYLAMQLVREDFKIHGFEVTSKPKYVLIYNQFLSARHGLILFELL